MLVKTFLRLQFVASGNTRWEHRIAVISPYAQQVILLRRTIKAMLGVSEGKSCPIDVNTVDGFQVISDNPSSNQHCFPHISSRGPIPDASSRAFGDCYRLPSMFVYVLRYWLFRSVKGSLWRYNLGSTLM